MREQLMSWMAGCEQGDAPYNQYVAFETKLTRFSDDGACVDLVPFKRPFLLLAPFDENGTIVDMAALRAVREYAKHCNDHTKELLLNWIRGDEMSMLNEFPPGLEVPTIYS